jgi:hypothetical protein
MGAALWLDIEGGGRSKWGGGAGGGKNPANMHEHHATDVLHACKCNGQSIRMYSKVGWNDFLLCAQSL